MIFIIFIIFYLDQDWLFQKTVFFEKIILSFSKYNWFNI